MNWLISGGCGFIGTSLIEKLRQDSSGHNFRILDDISVGSREDLRQVTSFSEKHSKEICAVPKGCELVVGDIRDALVCTECCIGVDVVVHLAAKTGVAPSVKDPRTDMETNAIGTFNLLEGARLKGVPHFVFASSGAAVGEVLPPLSEKSTPRPVSPYGASKLTGEAYCSAYGRTFGIRTVVLRFGNVYGPRSLHKQSVVAKFIKNALKGETLEIYGDGFQTRDFIFVDDLLHAIIKASRIDASGEILQIATNRETTIDEIGEHIVNIMNRLTGRRPKIKHSAPRLGDVRRNYSDISKANRILRWKPQVSLLDGIETTARYIIDKS